MNPATIARYEALGWVFDHDSYENHHNGDWEDDYTIKSPRLDAPFAAYEQYNDDLNEMEAPWVWMTERALLVAEKLAYVCQRLDSYENESSVARAMEKALLKDPDAKRVTITVKLV